MELTHAEKEALLARLAARQPRQYNPDCDITIDDMMARLGAHQSRNVAVRILKDAVKSGEMTEEVAIRRGKQIHVYQFVGGAHDAA